MTAEAAIRRFPRVELLEGVTPIQRLRGIEDALGSAPNGARLFAKREDLMGVGGGGNKLRKLEFLIGDARDQRADTVIAVGGRQSNYARLAAAASARFGLQCELVLANMVPIHDIEYQQGGNVLLDRLFGARIHELAVGIDPMIFAEGRARHLRAEGRTVYLTGMGGSSSVGCLGYAACALEIARQEAELGFTFDRVIVANGSSGSHAGLAAGFAVMGRSPAIVQSFAVLASEVDARQATIEKAQATLVRLDPSARIDDRDIVVQGTQRGSGYGAVTDEMLDAVRLMATREGLLLDPVYSGKAFAGLLAAARGGQFREGQNILFLVTGGTPALFAYRRALVPGI